MTTAPLIAIVVLLLASPAWAVNKCTNPDGAVVYQDAPCKQVAPGDRQEPRRSAISATAPDGQPKVILKAPTEWTGPIHARPARVAASSTYDSAVQQARANCGERALEEPVIGMAESDVWRCTVFGIVAKPDDVNTTETAAGVSKQFVYRSYSTIKYLYVRNGVVTGIQR